MAKLKNNRALPLQVPANKGPQEIESRFLALYDTADAKQAFLRELVFTGYLLRSFGVSTQIMDLERSGQLEKMNDQEKRETIAKIILGNAVTFTNSKTGTLEEVEQPKVEATGLLQIGA